MFLSEQRLANLCGTTKRTIDYALSRGDGFAIQSIRERFGVEIMIVREPTDPMHRARIVLKENRSSRR